METLLQAATTDFGTVEYKGWAVIMYYINLIQNYFQGYPWQIVTSYTIAMDSIIALIVLFLMFLFRVWRQQRRDKKEKDFSCEKSFSVFVSYMYNSVAYVLHHGDIVRNNKHGQISFVMKLFKQMYNLRLNRYIQ